MNISRQISAGTNKHASRLITAANELQKISDKVIAPNGVWNSVAIIKSGGVKLDSKEIDLEFVVPFDDNLESNETEITVYNLSDNTINQLKDKAVITIEAGYKGDTGIIFKGNIVKKSTKFDGCDKITTIKCTDDIFDKDLKNISYGGGIKASAILDKLLDMTGLPVVANKKRRDYTYANSVSIDEPLETAIKKFSDICGVSTFVSKGGIYCQYIKDYTDVNFTVSEETGMIGSPEPYTEELTAAEFTDTVEGYEIKMLLQHRISAAAGIKLKSKHANGTFRVRSGEHTFNSTECTTKIKVF